jgi:hypothetical protein
VDVARDIAVDSAGNVYVTGYSRGSGTDNDFATIKYLPDSNIPDWVARYDGPRSSGDHARSIAIDEFGYIYVTGDSQGQFSYQDFTTIKYDPNSTELWVRRYNGLSGDNDRAQALVLDGLGNVYITGCSDTDSNGLDYVTIKYTTLGSEQWVRRYNGPGNGEDFPRGIAVDGSGNVFVTGDSYDDGTGKDYATIKYSPLGVELWVARYNGPIDSDDFARSIAVDSSGNAYVTGATSDDYPIDPNFVTVKYDPNGNEVWVATFQGPGNAADRGNAVIVDDMANVYVTGSSEGSVKRADYTTIKYDTDGNQLDVATYDAEWMYDAAYDIVIDDSNNVYITGSSYGGGTTDYDFATVKYSQPICTGSLAGDITGDCKVNMRDFAKMALDWLKCNLDPPEACEK